MSSETVKTTSEPRGDWQIPKESGKRVLDVNDKAIHDDPRVQRAYEAVKKAGYDHFMGEITDAERAGAENAYNFMKQVVAEELGGHALDELGIVAPEARKD